MQDGRTRRAYKPEHAVDLDTEAIVAARSTPPIRATPAPSTTRRTRPPEA
jgi:hypothetical protein